MAANSGDMVVRNETSLHFFMAIWTGVCLIHLGFLLLQLLVVIGQFAMPRVSVSIITEVASMTRWARVALSRKWNRCRCICGITAANRFPDVQFEASLVCSCTSRSLTMSNDKCPSFPTAIRFQQDLQINGLSERSQESYGRAIRKFSEFIKREPDSAREDDLRNYLLFIKNDLQWSSSTINVAQQGLKKYFTITCPRTWD